MADKIQFYFDPNLKHNITVIKRSDGKRDIKLNSAINVVNTGDVVAKVVPSNAPKDKDVVHEQDFNKISAGMNVTYDREKRIFIAKTYGFVLLHKKDIFVDIPILVNDSITKAVLLLHPNRFGIWPTIDDILAIVNHENITEVEEVADIKALLSKASKGKPRLVKMLVAKGKEPVKGIKAYNKLLIDTEKKAGKVREDGSIDFHEKESVIKISKGQVIGEAIPGVKAVDGVNLYGNSIPAQKEENTSYIMRKNIEKRDDNKFVSSVEGVLQIDGREITVNEVLVIEGDVDYHQGNIDFTGTVHIQKSILPGFKVVAGGDVIVDGSVDDAEIHAGGNITIDKGIISQTGKTVIEAKGTIKAKYVMDSELTAERDVIIQDSIHNSTVTAYENVMLTSKKGQIIGGNITAKYKVECINLGSVSENATMVYVGKDPIIVAQLHENSTKFDEINKEFKSIQKDIKNKWDEKFFTAPEEYIQEIKPEKREEFAPVAKKYMELKNQVEELEEERKELNAQLKIEPPPKVVVHNNTYGGVVIHIYDSVKKIDQKFVGTMFIEENKEIVGKPIN